MVSLTVDVYRAMLCLLFCSFVYRHPSCITFTMTMTMDNVQTFHFEDVLRRPSKNFVLKYNGGMGCIDVHSEEHIYAWKEENTA